MGRTRETIGRVKWLAALAVVTVLEGAQQPRLEEVVARVDRYLSEYGARLENVVLEETYRQRALGGGGLRLIRILHSDYALTFVRGREEWIGYRDTFEVDGQPVRNRDDRLTRLLASGAVSQARRINDQNARYNLASERFPRTVNKPTLPLELLQPRYRNRFTARRTGSEPFGDRLGWVLEFRERRRPTIVGTPDGKDLVSQVELLVDPLNGEIHRTTISWGGVKGSIVVQYGLVDGLSVLVPLSMRERFTIAPGDDFDSDAAYTNYRTFQTSGRLIEP
jgi:hypothetical protein